MVRAIEAVIDEQDNIQLLYPAKLRGKCRALVIVLEGELPDTALLSEAAVAEDWNRPDEDAAWEHLQRER